MKACADSESSNLSVASGGKIDGKSRLKNYFWLAAVLGENWITVLRDPTSKTQERKQYSTWDLLERDVLTRVCNTMVLKNASF